MLSDAVMLQDVSSLVGSRHYLLFKVVFAEKPIAFWQKLLQYVFSFSPAEGKRGRPDR